MWDPGFEVAEAVKARLFGYRRSFCMTSIHHRGSEDEPGLVLALDAAKGAVCHGLALAVKPGTEDTALSDLRERELVSSAYMEKKVELVLEDGRIETGIVYVVDPDHAQYCGGLALELQAQIIAQAVGGRGPNCEYLYRTTERLKSLDLPDRELENLTRRVQTLRKVD